MGNTFHGTSVSRWWWKTSRAWLVPSPAQAVKASPADGYTLLFAITTTMVQNRVLYKNLPYDPDKDFVLISTMSGGSLVFLGTQVDRRGERQGNSSSTRAETRRAWAPMVPGSGAHIVVTELNKHFGLQMEAVHYRGQQMQDFNAGVLQAAQGQHTRATNSPAARDRT